LDNALRLETNNRSAESATWRFEFDNDVFFHEICLGHNIPRGFVYVPDPIGLSMHYKAALKPVNPLASWPLMKDVHVFSECCLL